MKDAEITDLIATAKEHGLKLESYLACRQTVALEEIARHLEDIDRRLGSVADELEALQP